MIVETNLQVECGCFRPRKQGLNSSLFLPDRSIECNTASYDSVDLDSGGDVSQSNRSSDPLSLIVRSSEAIQDRYHPHSHVDDMASQINHGSIKFIPSILQLFVTQRAGSAFSQCGFKLLQLLHSNTELCFVSNRVCRRLNILLKTILERKAIVRVQHDITDNECFFRKLHAKRSERRKGLLCRLSSHFGQLLSHLAQLSPDWTRCNQCSQQGPQCCDTRLIPVEPKLTATCRSLLPDLNCGESGFAAVGHSHRRRRRDKQQYGETHEAPEFKVCALASHFRPHSGDRWNAKTGHPSIPAEGRAA